MCSTQDRGRAHTFHVLLRFLFPRSCAFIHSHGLDLHEAGCLLSGRPILGLDLPGCFHLVSLILFLGPPSVLQMGSQLFSLGREGPLPSRDAPQMRCLRQRVPSVAPPASHCVPDAHVRLVEAWPLPCEVPLSSDGSIHSRFLPKSMTSLGVAKYSATLLAGFFCKEFTLFT